jgi:hypothetical protein
VRLRLSGASLGTALHCTVYSALCVLQLSALYTMHCVYCSCVLADPLTCSSRVGTVLLSPSRTTDAVAAALLAAAAYCASPPSEQYATNLIVLVVASADPAEAAAHFDGWFSGAVPSYGPASQLSCDRCATRRGVIF